MVTPLTPPGTPHRGNQQPRWRERQRKAIRAAGTPCGLRPASAPPSHPTRRTKRVPAAVPQIETRTLSKPPPNPPAILTQQAATRSAAQATKLPGTIQMSMMFRRGSSCGAARILSVGSDQGSVISEWERAAPRPLTHADRLLLTTGDHPHHRQLMQSGRCREASTPRVRGHGQQPLCTQI